MEDRARRIIAKADKMAAERSTLEGHWQEVADEIIGRRDFVNTRTPGDKRFDRIYDTTALHASGLLVVGLHSLLSNPATRWASLAADNPRIDPIWRVRMWLQAAEAWLYRVWSKPRRNFNGQMLESYFDLVNFGFTALGCEDIPGDGPLFSAHPAGQIFLGDDRFGRVDTVVRKFCWTAQQAKDAWGDRAGREVDKFIEARQEEHPCEFLHIVQPSTVDTRLRYTKTRQPWESVYVSRTDGIVVDEGGFDYFPYAVARWQKDSGSPYPNGCPSMNALPEARMLNAMSYTQLRAAQKATDPPILMPNEGVMRPFRSQAGGQTFYDPMFAQGGNPIFPMPVDARGVGIGIEMLRDRQQKIQEHYLFEILSMIRDPRMTATQVLEISSNVMRVVAPRLGTFQEQFLEQIVANTFSIELRSGRLLAAIGPPPPELAGQNLRVVYNSPVSRAQRGSDVQAMMMLLQQATAFAQLDPDVIHNLNGDEWIRRLADYEGVPASCLRSMEDVIARRQAEREIAARQSDLQTIGGAAEAAGKAAPALKLLQGGEGQGQAA